MGARECLCVGIKGTFIFLDHFPLSQSLWPPLAVAVAHAGSVNKRSVPSWWVLIRSLQGKLLATKHLQLKKLGNALKFPSNLIHPDLSIPPAHCALLCWNAFRTQPGREPAASWRNSVCHGCVSVWNDCLRPLRTAAGQRGAPSASRRLLTGCKSAPEHGSHWRLAEKVSERLHRVRGYSDQRISTLLITWVRPVAWN